ncbi:unnamed protein product [Rhizophagus irregularis]|nr:unnamed protein product [Rhizophagus irregularis]
MTLPEVESLKELSIDRELKLPPRDGTECSFVELWDANIREHLIPDSTYVRNNSRNMGTGSDRPDYGLILNHVCLFRGEEKSPSDNEDPKSELRSKLVWTYDPVPYVLGKILCLFHGYYANGPLKHNFCCHREGRQIIEVCGKNIKKTYIGPDAHDRVERLVNVYGKLEQKGVPNVDHLKYVEKEKKCSIPFPKRNERKTKRSGIA